MEALISTLAFRKVPKVELDKKRKSVSTSISHHPKKPRLLEEVLSGEVEPSLVPSYTTEGIQYVGLLRYRSIYGYKTSE